jgi:hypothetical protein
MIAQLVFVVMDNQSAKPLFAALRAFNRVKFQENAAQSAMVTMVFGSFIFYIGRKSN